MELSNDDTEAALDEYARANPDVQHPERAAMGDEVTLDFEGFVDGVPFEGGKGEQYPLLLGSGYFIPGFEEQVAGAAVGEERDVKGHLPHGVRPGAGRQGRGVPYQGPPDHPAGHAGVGR